MDSSVTRAAYVPAWQTELFGMSKNRRPARKRRHSAQKIGTRENADRRPLGRLDRLLDHYLVLMLFLTLISLTLLGAATPLLTSLLGLVLCVTGMAQRRIKADLWVLIPLILYQVFSVISFCMAYNGISTGMIADVISIQAFYPVVYLLMAFLSEEERLWLKRLCILWTGCVAVVGLIQFVLRAMSGRAARLDGVFGNPNATGAFLVIGWLVLQTCFSEREEDGRRLWPGLEPLLLTVLTLTLSMGSFVSMAAGVLVLILSQVRGRTRREILAFACDLLARAGFGVGLGVLMYTAARRSGQPWLCIPLALYLLALMLFWDRFRSFLKDFPKAAVAMTVLGALATVAVILSRPSSIATFQERLAMMKNGLGYLTVHPLWGLGPYRWRAYNYLDSDIYFNTYHIHNVPLHIGVELGLPAMAMAVAVLVRRFVKKSKPGHIAGFTAFVVHNLIDTSFFYAGVTAMTLMTVGEPGNGGKQLPATVVRLIFVAYAALFAVYFFYGLGQI